MQALLILVLLPIGVGVLSVLVFGSMKRAAVATTIGSPLLVFLCVKLIEPDDPWSALATALVSPLVIAFGLFAMLLCYGRPRARKQHGWTDA